MQTYGESTKFAIPWLTFLPSHSMNFPKIAIIGTGNVAWHLARMFDSIGNQASYIYSRNTDASKEFAQNFNLKIIPSLDLIPEDCDICFLAVKDDAISVLSKEIKTSALVVHTSGSTSLDELENNRKGVVWTVQSLRKGIDTEYHTIPLLIECNNEADRTLLGAIFSKISSSIFYKNSEERLQAHTAAVITNNFSNHLYSIANKLLDEVGLPFDLMLPLIEEETRKIKLNSPSEIQTGPAIRRDEITIAKQQELLAKNLQWQALYNIMTNLIQENKND